MFGAGRFQSQIVWQRTSAHNDQAFGSVSDHILFYGQPASKENARVPLDPDYIKQFYRHKDERGRYQLGDLTGAGTTQGESSEPWLGADPVVVGRCWSVPRTGAYAKWIEENIIPGYRSIEGIHARLNVLFYEANMVVWPQRGTMPRLKRYLAASEGRLCGDLWTDIKVIGAHAKERLGYPTQKPLALLERIIKASSNEGDVVLDPFCGCATACVAADKLGRKWVGIDISPKAVELVNMRLQQTMGSLFHHDYVTARTDIPRRTDIDAPIPYRQNKHVLFGQQEGLCNGCRVMFPFPNFTIDHVVPQSRGGTDHLDNLQLLCGHCNSLKGDRPMEYLIARLKETAPA